MACIGNSEYLTQFGMKSSGGSTFRSAPRVSRETELSLLLGELSAEEAAGYVLGSLRPITEAELDRAAVRHAPAGRLRAAGFAVIHTPGKLRVGIQHVSIVWSSNDPIDYQVVPWSPEVSERFEECFNDSQN